jgi:hypothetical protein
VLEIKNKKKRRHQTVPTASRIVHAQRTLGVNIPAMSTEQLKVSDYGNKRPIITKRHGMYPPFQKLHSHHTS